MLIFAHTRTHQAKNSQTANEGEIRVDGGGGDGAAIRFYTTVPKRKREKSVARAMKILRSDANSHLACCETFSISGPISAAMR